MGAGSAIPVTRGLGPCIEEQRLCWRTARDRQWGTQRQQAPVRLCRRDQQSCLRQADFISDGIRASLTMDLSSKRPKRLLKENEELWLQRGLADPP